MSTNRLRTILTALALLGFSADVALAPAVADAHLAKWGSWEITHRNLSKLFPEADPNAWRIKRYQYSEKEVALLEKELGFELYPEDKTPEFYVAHDDQGSFLGVAIFIDPRTKVRTALVFQAVLPEAATPPAGARPDDEGSPAAEPDADFRPADSPAAPGIDDEPWEQVPLQEPPT